MKAVEFGAKWILGRGSVNGDHLGTEFGHARGDAVLRNDGEDQHRDYRNHGGLRKEFWRKCEAEAGEKIDDSGDDAEVVESPEGDADDGAGLVAARESGEERRGDGEAEVNDRAEPGAEREELDES